MGVEAYRAPGRAQTQARKQAGGGQVVDGALADGQAVGDLAGGEEGHGSSGVV